MTTFGFAGLYQFEKFRVDADGNELPGTREIISPWQGNLITDAGLNYLGSTNHDNLAMCRIGTGNTAPANSDTALGAQVGLTTATGSGGGTGYNATDRFVWRRVAYRFSAGTVSDVNLAEVGVAASNSVSLFSRSLIKDSSGTPTTITLASDEVLDVLYELRMYLPAQDITVPATIDGVANTVTIRVTENVVNLNRWALYVGMWMRPPAEYNYGVPLEDMPAALSNWVGLRTGVTLTVAAYTQGTFTTNCTAVLGLTSGNFATGVGCVLFSGVGTSETGTFSPQSYGWWAYGFATKLNKTNVRTATINVGVTWGRYTP